MQHHLQPSIGICAAIEYHSESAVDHFTPTDAAAVMQADPCCSAERIAYKILYGHIRSEAAAIADIACLSIWTVCAAHIVMIAAEHDRCADRSLLDRIVERFRDADPSFAVRI